MGGRLILIRSILSGIPVYWFSLAKIPKTILNILRQRIFLFLWGNTTQKKCLHLVDWMALSRLYEYGGWNIKNLEWFRFSLRMKTCRMALNGEGIWSHIIRHNYLKDRYLDD